MGDYGEDMGKVLNFSFSWLGEAWAVSSFILLFLLYLFDSGFREFMKNSEELGMTLLALSCIVAVSLAVNYMGARITLFALKKKGFGNIGLGASGFFRYVILQVFTFLSAIFPWMETKLLAVGVVSVVVLVSTGISLIMVFARRIFDAGPGPGASELSAILGAGGLFILSLIALAVLSTYVGTRLFMAHFVFLGGKTGVKDSVKKSWELTNGKFWAIFGRSTAFSLVVGIMFAIIGIAMGAFSVFFGLLATGQTESNVSRFTVIMLLSLVQPISLFVGSYGMTGIYSCFDSPSPAPGGPPSDQSKPSIQTK